MMPKFLIEQMLMILMETNIERKMGLGLVEFEIAAWQPGINMHEALETQVCVCVCMCMLLKLKGINLEGSLGGSVG